MNLYFYVYELEKGSRCSFTFYYYPDYPGNMIAGRVEVDLKVQEYEAKFLLENQYVLDEKEKNYILESVLKNLEL